MRVRIVHRRPLVGIPSASGIESTPQGLYVIGDDFPWLCRLDPEFRVVERIRIHPAEPATGTLRIARESKPDFEALAARSSGSGLELFVFGSGSKPRSREVLARVCSGATTSVTLHDTAEFYAALRQAAGLGPKSLNIEGALIHDDDLYLFNRGINVVARCVLDEFLAHLENHAACPALQIHRVPLPSIDGREAGFSGATLIPGSSTVLFTASVEETTDWTVDGAVAGSFIGLFDLPLDAQPAEPRCIVLCGEDGAVLPIKVESVAVVGSASPAALRLLLVTDSDDGDSGLIEAMLDLG